MAEMNPYEEMRRRQVEENKRKLEELRVHQLSAAVREAAARPKLKRKAPAPRNPGPPRRSGRLASLPEQPDYLKGAASNTTNGPCASEEARAYAITKALQLEDELGSGHPIFHKSLSKPMSGWGALSLPMEFCKKHLLESKKKIVLVDEGGAEFGMLYLLNCYTGCFSGGWSEFANDHKLANDDCLMFQMVEKTKFKVYIFRASSYCEMRPLKLRACNQSRILKMRQVTRIK